MKKFLLAAGLMLAASWPSTTQAACSQGFYAGLIRQAKSAERYDRACSRALRGKNIAQTCTACRPAIQFTLRLDRTIRKNPSCFQDRAFRRLVADIKRHRDSVRFVARGCGF